MALKGLLFPYVKNGQLYESAWHRPTFRHVDVFRGKMEVLMIVYASKDWCMENPDDFFDNEPIVVRPADVLTYFAPLAVGVPTTPLIDKALEFLQTISPQADGSPYANCRFNYSAATIL